MKKTTIKIVLAALCLNFSSYGQQPEAVKALKIGDKVPELSYSYLENHIRKTEKLSDHKGKIIILDFWATWCAPCVAMIPKMDSLQKAYAGKVLFLSVTTQNDAIVQPFMAKLEKRDQQHYIVPQVTSDTRLSQLFPHYSLPHYVWIDQQGTVVANTEFTEINAKNIEALLNKQPVQVKQLAYVAPMNYDNEVPLLINGNGGNGEDLVYHSILTKYKPGLQLQRIIRPGADGSLRILCKNLNPLQLVASAYLDKGPDYLLMLDSIQLNIKDTSKLTSNLIGMEYDKWLASGNGYCYELKVPAALKKQAFDIMRADVARFFPDFEIEMVSRKEHTLELVNAGNTDQLKTKGGPVSLSADQFGSAVRNNTLRNWVAAINNQHLTTMPVIDKTGITTNIDLELTAGFKDLRAANQQLQAYGLMLVPGTREVPVIQVNDRQPTPPN